MFRHACHCARVPGGLPSSLRTAAGKVFPASERLALLASCPARSRPVVPALLPSPLRSAFLHAGSATRLALSPRSAVPTPWARAVLPASWPRPPLSVLQAVKLRRYSRPHWYDDRDQHKNSWWSRTSRGKYLAYVFPRRGAAWGWGSWHGRLDPHRTVYVLLGINTAVFVAWKYAEELYRQEGNWKFLAFMRRNFSAGYLSSVRDGRVWTFLTAAYSHRDFSHFLLNMVVLFSFGPAVAYTIGTGSFLALYHAAGLVSTVGSVAYTRLFMPRFSQEFIGASGSLMGITILFACMYPQTPIYLFMLLPVPAGLAAAGFVLMDIFGAFAASRASGASGSIGHLFGAATGMLYYLAKFKK